MRPTGDDDATTMCLLSHSHPQPQCNMRSRSHPRRHTSRQGCAHAFTHDTNAATPLSRSPLSSRLAMRVRPCTHPPPSPTTRMPRSHSLPRHHPPRNEDVPLLSPASFTRTRMTCPRWPRPHARVAARHDDNYVDKGDAHLRSPLHTLVQRTTRQ